jgi:hypothetical protein
LNGSLSLPVFKVTAQQFAATAASLTGREKGEWTMAFDKLMLGKKAKKKAAGGAKKAHGKHHHKKNHKHKKAAK